MIKKILMIVIITNLNINCSKNYEKQNLDINVSGRVTNQDNVGVGNIIIFIERGKYGNFAPTVYKDYQTVTTNSSGGYNYLVKDDNYNYRICCGIPTGYSIVGQVCKDVNKTILNSQTIPNYIDFKITN